MNPQEALKPLSSAAENPYMTLSYLASVGNTSTTATPATLLWVSDDPPGPVVLTALAGRWRLRPVPTNDSFARHAEGVAAVLIDATRPEPDVLRLSALLDQLERTGLVGLLLLGASPSEANRLLDRRGQFAVGSIGSAPEVIAAQIETLLHLQPAMMNLRDELARVRTLGASVGHIDEEMRMAARLQRDFLPSSLPHVGPVRFGIMFRPAEWVSGDIYDVSRLDERNVGFYVADAVGHGMPAALLTMFIKRALPTKAIGEGDYEIISPDTAMAELNEAICAQELSSCQFCSAVYGVVDTHTLEMTYARGGHPEPLLLGADGSMRELDAVGGLLGIFPGDSYDLGRVQLARGDRLVLYTDGAEGVFRHANSTGHDEFVAEVAKCRNLSPELMALQLAGIIDDRQGDENPEDDITILILDVADEDE